MDENVENIKEQLGLYETFLADNTVGESALSEIIAGYNNAKAMLTSLEDKKVQDRIGKDSLASNMFVFYFPKHYNVSPSCVHSFFIDGINKIIDIYVIDSENTPICSIEEAGNIPGEAKIYYLSKNIKEIYSRALGGFRLIGLDKEEMSISNFKPRIVKYKFEFESNKVQ